MARMCIVPKALAIAAQTFAKKPAVLGEILVVLVGGDAAVEKRLTDVQRYVLAECRAEIAEIEARRMEVAERKRRNRAKGGK